MILLTRLSGTVFALNAELIERVDSTPDTVITLIGGTKYVVAEPLHEVVATVREHRAEVLALSDAWTFGAADQQRAARRRGSLAVVAAYPGATAEHAGQPGPAEPGTSNGATS